MNDIILTSQKLYKSYHDGTSTVEVLKGVDLAITKGDRIAIIGPSGSGKSTLLHLLGGLDKPTSGLIILGNVNWQKINEKQRCQLRNQQLGFVYQFHHLLPEFTALENVMMPLLLAGMAVKDAEEKAINMLEQVGLKPRLTHKPAQLSGGERQRVAIARALVHQPHCVLADEPTGNLDEATASKVFDLMLELNKKMNTALVIVTHDQRIAERMDRVLVLHEGSLYARE
ncbi:TPA: lipoprotein-releasing ABC transporter ATP-binding protein LolD [Legionella pneumophila subsp. pneumophila]|uniref:lipoprotein-releasing ABC transporter ATP-binding protein LolD n=1 Tax=Legionella pneumophila TaxID=446 RepID=UPI0007707F4B|nr:lipoprotein-releasing ABC transporter ATP-binding protein LolD [Legionella pneumophila]HAT9088382.1 lipoprotein-releasing ABC transporter ATP-binding protein LolD [Legionella pneumophila subsp. pneumophila]CZO85813.1 Lipoprotein-releasing system ATP-binding protein LolD [Legionella pneumophila]HAT1989240.1 lipoprotein-releasing ABC transporter ATP-binding protein LolD [Legionella pneumophila]HAT1992120.1 lipoprotein-releasing ABC transporter ATP-binding protein LolD [Legionella pneumophila]